MELEAWAQLAPPESASGTGGFTAGVPRHAVYDPAAMLQQLAVSRPALGELTVCSGGLVAALGFHRAL